MTKERRWFQFHLSTAIVLLVAASVALYGNVLLYGYPRQKEPDLHVDLDDRIRFAYLVVKVAVPLMSIAGLVLIGWICEWWARNRW